MQSQAQSVKNGLASEEEVMADRPEERLLLSSNQNEPNVFLGDQENSKHPSCNYL